MKTASRKIRSESPDIVLVSNPDPFTCSSYYQSDNTIGFNKDMFRFGHGVVENQTEEILAHELFHWASLLPLTEKEADDVWRATRRPWKLGDPLQTFVERVNPHKIE